MLPGSVTTSDVDAIHFRPPGDLEEVLQAAEAVADKQGLSRNWLNIEAGLFSSSMPTGWEVRRIHVGTFGRLEAYAIGRLDLIAMKFYAHREVDLEHLEKMVIAPEELAFTESHLKGLLERLPDDKSKIEMAIHILRNWNVTS